MKPAKSGSLTLSFLVSLFLVFLLAGCNSPTAPNTSSPPPSATPTPAASGGYIYGEVSDADGCLVGAVIEILDGVAAGSRAVQTSEQCVRDNSGIRLSYIIHGLPLGTRVRLRASMAGYQSQEKSATPQFAQTIEPETPSVDFKLVR